MTTRRARVGSGFFVLLSIVGSVAIASAQVPPRPAVDIRQVPEMWHSIRVADFNADGRMDLIAGLVSPSGPAVFDRVAVRLGNGNGTFASPLLAPWTGRPLATGDYNRDGRVDAVVLGTGGALAILAGRGDGTFTVGSRLASLADVEFGVSTDLNSDGHLDVVIAAGHVVEVFPGRSDFSFGAPVTFPATTHGPRAAFVADFNRDGRRDLAVAQRFGAVFLYLNRGNWQFATSQLPIADEELQGLTAADLNADGKQDLVVTHSVADYPAWTEGGVEVLLGNGNGTFAAPVRYNTGLPGPYTVVVADLNRDGKRDVAVGSRSWNWDEEGRAYWDSISIFPGRGDGTLAPAAHFTLDTGLYHSHAPWLDKHHALRTADVNRDGRPDLIAAPGAVILNRAPAPNRLPIVDAGPDITMVAGDARTLTAAIVEPDWDWVTVRWRDEAGRWISDSPTAYYSGPWEGSEGSVIVTVTDSRGGIASDRFEVRVVPGDLVLYEPAAESTHAPGVPMAIRWSANITSDLMSFRVSASPDVMNTWTVIPECASVAAHLRECVWTSPGPKGNIWYLKIEALSDEGDVLAAVVSAPFRIAAPSDPATWLEVTAPRGGARFASGSGVLIGWTTSPDIPPTNFRISVSPDNFATSRVLQDDVPVGEREITWFNAGPAATTWRVKVEAVEPGGALVASDTSDAFVIDPPGAGEFPWPWEENFDIGAVAAAGSASYADGVFTVRGSGADIWGTADEFHQVITRWSGDFVFTARVRSVENINQWTKAGVMIREDISPGSPHASLFVTPTTVKGISFQRRPVRGGSSVSTTLPGSTAPMWVRLVRTGNAVAAYYRKTATDPWTLIGRQEFARLPTFVEPMLVVSSHVDGRLATATFDNVTITAPGAVAQDSGSE